MRSIPLPWKHFSAPSFPAPSDFTLTAKMDHSLCFYRITVGQAQSRCIALDGRPQCMHRTQG